MTRRTAPSRLTVEELADIRRQHASGMSAGVIADRLNLPWHTVRGVITGRTYRNDRGAYGQTTRRSA